MEWDKAEDLKKDVEQIVKNLKLEYVKTSRIFCFRTRKSKSRATARIWAFPKIFQQVLDITPAYIIEVISERFNKLSSEQKTKVLIHELLHIPKNFSGSLLPHKYGNKRIDLEVERLYKRLVIPKKFKLW